MGGRGSKSGSSRGSGSLSKLSDEELEKLHDKAYEKNRKTFEDGVKVLEDKGYVNFRNVNGSMVMFETNKGKNSKEAQSIIARIKKTQQELLKIQNEQRKRMRAKRQEETKNELPF